MPHSIDDQVRDCVQQAADCAERANEVNNPRERADWLSLHGRYLALARGIETSRRHRAKAASFRSQSPTGGRRRA